MNARRLLTNVILWPIRRVFSELVRRSYLRRFDLRVACRDCRQRFRVERGRIHNQDWIDRWMCGRCIAKTCQLEKWG